MFPSCVSIFLRGFKLFRKRRSNLYASSSSQLMSLLIPFRKPRASRMSRTGTNSRRLPKIIKRTFWPGLIFHFSRIARGINICLNLWIHIGSAADMCILDVTICMTRHRGPVTFGSIAEHSHRLQSRHGRLPDLFPIDERGV